MLAALRSAIAPLALATAEQDAELRGSSLRSSEPASPEDSSLEDSKEGKGPSSEETRRPLLAVRATRAVALHYLFRS